MKKRNTKGGNVRQSQNQQVIVNIQAPQRRAKRAKNRKIMQFSNFSARPSFASRINPSQNFVRGALSENEIIALRPNIQSQEMEKVLERQLNAYLERVGTIPNRLEITQSSPQFKPDDNDIDGTVQNFNSLETPSVVAEAIGKSGKTRLQMDKINARARERTRERAEKAKEAEVAKKAKEAKERDELPFEG